MKLETILVPYDGSEQAKRALEYAKDLAAIAGGACYVRAVHVMPSDLINEKDLDGRDALVYYAKKHDADLIVMGRRGLGGLRGMLGSVSYGVLHGADIPVLTVK